ncbi:MAG: hypothetical protein M1816_005044 [Peltula sp. TS41687]|nr:MAG: hypothetical protein M1816_005044 [Peltula sp. TS41687]
MFVQSPAKSVVKVELEAQRSYLPPSDKTLLSSSTPSQQDFPREQTLHSSPSRWTLSASSTPALPRSSFDPSGDEYPRNLPSLRTSRSRRSTEGLPQSQSPNCRRKGSGVYYTASWGSPYTNSDSEVQAEARRHRRCQSTQSSEFDLDHPIFRVGVDRLQPGLSSHLNRNDPASPYSLHATQRGSVSSFGSIASRIPRHTSNGTLAYERIKLYLNRQVNSERGNWWSDDSAESQEGHLSGPGNVDFPTKKTDHFWLDLDDSDGQQTIASLPSAGTTLQERNRETSMAISMNDDAGEHESRDGSDMMTPGAKEDPAGRLEQSNDLTSPTTVSDVTSPTIGVNGHTPVQASPNVDKPPSSAISTQDGEARHAVQHKTPSKTESRGSDRGSIQRRNSVGLGFRKRLVWRGKAYVIAPPFHDDRGDGINSPRLMSPAEWAKRLQDWEDQGYDTRGFGYWDWQDTVSPEAAKGQSTSIYPSAETPPDEWDMKSYPVKLPNLKEWESYVNKLNEERLRALGVSTGTQEAPTVTLTADVPTDRRSPSPYPLFAISPPQKVSSVHSNRSAPPATDLSPPFMNEGLSATSIAHGIPITASAGLPTIITGFPIPGQSSVYNEQQLAFAIQPARLPITQQGIPATQPLYNGLALHTSPSYGALVGLPSVGTILQPMGMESTQTYEDARQMQLIQQMQAHQNMLRQLGQVPVLNQTSLNQGKKRRISDARRLPQGQAFLDFNNIDPRLGVPVNGISNDPHVQSTDVRYYLDPSTEYHVERNEARVKSTSPFDSGGILPDLEDLTPGYAEYPRSRHLTNMQFAGDEPPPSNHDLVLHSPQPRGRPHSLSKGIEDYQRLEKENSSLGGLTAQGLRKSASTGLLQPLDGGLNTMTTKIAQASSASSTDYNRASDARSEFSDVNYPHPKAPQGSSMHSLNTKLIVDAEGSRSDPNLPFISGNNLSTGQLRQTPKSSRPNTGATGRMSTKLNVEAAAFKPRARLPATEFSFSSTVGSYKPIASKIPFIDLKGIKTVSEMVRDRTAKSGSPYGAHDRIFDFDGITVPDKNSKAIPIVRPDGSALDTSDRQEDAEQEEDESGSILQTTARHKKARRASRAGDEVPQFATPSYPFEHDQLRISQENPLDCAHHPTVNEEAAVEAVKEEQDTSVNNNNNARSISRSAVRQKRQHVSMSEDDGAKHVDSAPSPINDPLPTINGDEENTSMDIQGKSIPDIDQSSSSGHATTAPDEETHNHAVQASTSNMTKPLEPRLALGTRDKQGNVMEVNPSSEQSTGRLDEQSTRTHEQSSVGIEEPPSSLVQTSVPSSGMDEIQHNESLPARASRITDTNDLADPSLDQLNFALLHHEQSEAEPNGKSPKGSGKNENGESRSLSSPEGSDQSNRRSAYVDPSDGLPISKTPSLERQPQAVSNTYREYGSTLLEHDVTATAHMGLTNGPTISHLKPTDTLPASDWDSFISPNEEHKLLSRSKFFDRHVDRLFDRVLEQRLGPLEKSLQTIQALVTATSTNAKSTINRAPDIAEVPANSDADDEDDDSDLFQQQRIRSPPKNRRLDATKAFVLEALEAHTLALQSSFPSSDVSEIQQTLLEIKAASDRQRSEDRGDLSNLRSTLQDVLVESLPRYTEAMKDLSHTDTEKLQLRITELERNLEAADQRAKEELEGRVVAEHTVRQLHNADGQGQHDRSQTQKHIKLLERAGISLETTISEASIMNAVLQNHLREAQVAEDRRSQRYREADGDDNEVRKAVDALRIQLEESIKIRDGLRGKFDRLQEEVAVASRRIEAEQASWREKEKDHILAQEILNNRLDAEIRTRERLERETEALGAEQREASKIHIKCEQLETANTNLESMADRLQLENLELQKLIAKYQSEVNESRETGRAEVKRATSLMESQVEAANSQVNIVRAELEMELAQTRMELEHYKMKYDSAQANGQVSDDVAESEHGMSTTATEAAEASLQEQHRKYERHLEDLKFQHDLALRSAHDDKQRTEAHLLDRLGLSNAKTEHLQERISHLEEKLEISKAAASAAAQAAQQAKARFIVEGSSATSPSQMSESGHPRKTSPQAMRESILVLQDQLQERENRIEILEQELADVYREAPTKLKEQAAEIGWLRELLGVRMSDLEEIIRALSAPEYDRDAIKDAAIRLKANVEMQQQERERASTTDRPKFPSFIRISALATPKTVLPLAAAWGSWRKGKENEHNGDAHETGLISADTPSKSWAPQQSFLSGLLTPPSTRARRSPVKVDAPEVPRTRSPSKMDEPAPVTSRPSSPWKQRPHTPTLPSTPRLLSHSSYDHDAKTKVVDENNDPTVKDDHDDSSVSDLIRGEASVSMRFGPPIQP